MEQQDLYTAVCSEKINSLIAQKSLKKYVVALEANIACSTLSRWLSGEIAVVNIERANRLASAIGCELKEIEKATV